jgi:hypothetical protein
VDLSREFHQRITAFQQKRFGSLDLAITWIFGINTNDIESSKRFTRNLILSIAAQPRHMKRLEFDLEKFVEQFDIFFRTFDVDFVEQH